MLNVSNLKDGAFAVCNVGGLEAMLEQVRQLNQGSREAQRDAANVALRGIGNILISTGNKCGSLNEIAKTVTIALTISRDSDELCESASVVFANLSLTPDGTSAAINARSHRAIHSSLLPRGVTVKRFVESFVADEEPRQVTSLQIQVPLQISRLHFHV